MAIKLISTARWLANASGQNTDDNNSENEDTSYARFGVKGETQITSELTGFGQFEYNLDASKPEGENQEKTRLTFAGLKYNELRII
ncbi:Outer membrane protein N [Escherichia coli]|uniref:Outer membrane protein N n=1 Tax=Escherichia coli TaxID=562 RepID=A0A376S9J3_ECOLX|nr:Outer membrane protein N [Escherichia coli]